MRRACSTVGRCSRAKVERDGRGLRGSHLESSSPSMPRTSTSPHSRKTVGRPVRGAARTACSTPSQRALPLPSHLLLPSGQGRDSSRLTVASGITSALWRGPRRAAEAAASLQATPAAHQVAQERPEPSDGPGRQMMRCPLAGATAVPNQQSNSSRGAPAFLAAFSPCHVTASRPRPAPRRRGDRRQLQPPAAPPPPPRPASAHPALPPHPAPPPHRLACRGEASHAVRTERRLACRPSSLPPCPSPAHPHPGCRLRWFLRSC